MAVDYHAEAWLDLQACSILLWLERRDEWETTDPADLIHDPILRRIAEHAINAPAPLEAIEAGLIEEFGAEDAIDRIDRVRWAMSDPDAHTHASRRMEATRPDRSITPFLVSQQAESPELHEEVIGGLLRLGETMNVIAPPKVGKTWLVHSLALALSCGDDWLGRTTRKSRVLIVDNELHDATLRRRLHETMQVTGTDPATRLEAISLRGRLKNLHAVCDWLKGFPRGRWDVVVCDAFYRMLPPGKSENDNAEMAALYNALDETATRQSMAWVLVHHTSKGSQAGKGVTDVGSGAGSMSRAADAHVVLRRHRDENCVVMEAVARSFPPPSPTVMEWQYPRWIERADLDPEDLDDGKPLTSKDRFPVEQVIETLPTTPCDVREVVAQLRADGCSESHLKTIRAAIEAAGRVQVMRIGKDLMVSTSSANPL